MTYSPDISADQKKRYAKRLKGISWFPRFKTKSNLLIMLSTFRSGSNYILSNLGSLPDVEVVGYDGEVLKNGKYKTYYSISKSKATAKQCFSFIRKTQALHSSKYIAIKLTFEHLTHFKISITDLLKEFDTVKWIIVYRGNILDQYVSREKAKRNNFFRWYKGMNINQDAKIKLNINTFLSYEADVRLFYEELIDQVEGNAQFRDNLILARYEDLLGKELQVWIDNIASSFLKIPSAQAVSPYKKQAVRPLSEVIDNYADVETFINSQEYLQSYEIPPIKSEESLGSINVTKSSVLIGGMEPNLCHFMDNLLSLNGVGVALSDKISRGTFLFKDLFESVIPENIFKDPVHEKLLWQAFELSDRATFNESKNHLIGVISTIKWFRLRGMWYQKKFTHQSSLISLEIFLSFWYNTIFSKLKKSDQMRFLISSPVTLIYLNIFIKKYPNTKYVHFLNPPSEALQIPYHNIMAKWSNYLGIQLRTETVMYAYEDIVDTWCAYQSLLFNLPPEYLANNILIIDKVKFMHDPDVWLNKIFNFLSLKYKLKKIDIDDYVVSSNYATRGFNVKYFETLLDNHLGYQEIKRKLDCHAHV